MISTIHTAVIASVVLCLGSTPLNGQTVNPGTGNTYFRTEISLTFAMARAQADAVGGYVLSLGDAAEEQWVDATFPGAKWIGLTDEAQEGVWLWESGEPFAYQNWGTPTPGIPAAYDFVRSTSFGGGWFPVSDLDQPSFGYFAVIETEFPLGPSIEDLSVITSDTGVQWSWTNPVAFTSIDVYRGLQLVAQLPGDATSFTIASVPENRYWFHPQGGALPSAPVSKLATPFGYRMRVEGTEIATGDIGAVRVLLSNEEPVQAFSYGICHDSTALELVSINLGSIDDSVLPGGGLDFHSVAIHPEGFTVVAVLFGAGLTYIPIGTSHEMDIAQYQALGSAGESTTLDFCMIGSPIVQMSVVPYLSGVTLTPTTESGAIDIVHGFQRGDGNGDGAVDLADPIHNLEYLFYGGPSYCLDAQDTNDDGTVTIADPVYSLSYQFSGGFAPPSPLGVCAADPTPDALSCAQPPICP